MALQAEAAREEQEAIAALAMPLVLQSLDALDGPSLTESVRELLDSFEAVVREYGSAAAGSALEWFRGMRLDAGVKGRVNVPAAPAAPESFLRSAVAVGGAARLVGEPDVLDVKAERLILDEGRRQMLAAVDADREARGWARVPNPSACSFCLMLAIRSGAGYLYSRSSFTASNARFRGAGKFKVHDNCRCGLEPVWGRHEPTAAVRHAMATWERATKGRSGHDARVAFRQAIEGREVTGAPGRSSSSRSPSRRTDYATPQGRTPENQAAQLRILEAMPPAKTPEAAKWQADRIREIREFLSARGVSV